MKPTSHNSRSLADLDSDLSTIYQLSAAEWKKDYPNSPQPFPTQTHRSEHLQAAYYAQGREPLVEVNSIRAAVGLPPLTVKENKIKVTDARPGKSKHQPMPSEALDIAFTNIVGDEFKDIYPKPLFGKFAAIMRKHAKKLGVKILWGGNVKDGGDFKRLDDKPHFELAD